MPLPAPGLVPAPDGAADAKHLVFFERLARHELAHALASAPPAPDGGSN